MSIIAEIGLLRVASVNWTTVTSPVTPLYYQIPLLCGPLYLTPF